MKEALAQLIQATRANDDLKSQEGSPIFITILVVNVNGPNV